MKTPVIHDTIEGPPRRAERIVNQEDTLAAREKQKLIKRTLPKLGLYAEPERT